MRTHSRSGRGAARDALTSRRRTASARVRGHPVVDEEERRAGRTAVRGARRGEPGRLRELRRAGEVYGVSSVIALVDRLVPGRPAGLVLGHEDDPLIAVDHLPQRRPAAGGRPAVGELAEPGRSTAATKSSGARSPGSRRRAPRRDG